MTAGWTILLITIAVAAWTLVALVSRQLVRNPRRDPLGGLALLALAIYVRLVHRVRFRGLEHLSAGGTVGGPLIIVSNHTGGVDPLLIQAATSQFEIRWMMAADMMIPQLNALWEWLEIIPVNREEDRAADGAASAREAIRHLKAGGVLGVFPEGEIERPPRRLKPFAPGVGLLVRRTGAPVVPVAVTGTPVSDSAWGSLFRPSRAVVTFLPAADYRDSRMKPAEIAQDIRRRIGEAAGWPVE